MKNTHKQQENQDNDITQNLNKRRVDYNKLLEKQRVLMSLGKEYSIEIVNGNYKLISDFLSHKTFNKTQYTPNELRFIKDVKRHIVNKDIANKEEFVKNQLFAHDVHYVKVTRVPFGQLFKDVVEVDIDQAYWETAFQLGIVSESLYQRGSKGNISKQARLTALGSLAKKTYKFDFKGADMVSKKIVKDELLENLWFTICKRVSDVMHEVISELGSDFIFYWVDGIYMKNTPENISKAMSIFLKHGYQSKFKKINQIYFHEKGFSVNDYGSITREFTYPNYDQKGKRINYAKNFKLAEMANKIMNDEIDLVEQVKKEFKDEDESGDK